VGFLEKSVVRRLGGEAALGWVASAIEANRH
jgi:hypothetical protein